MSRGKFGYQQFRAYIFLCLILFVGCSVSKTSSLITESQTPYPQLTPSISIPEITTISPSSPTTTGSPESVFLLTSTPTIFPSIVDTPTLVESFPILRPAVFGVVYIGGSQPGIYLIDALEKTAVLIAMQEDPAWGLSWSPDGHRLAFSMAKPSPSIYSQIFVINSDGSSLTQMTRSPYYKGRTSWSSDNRSILFTEFKGNYDGDICKLDVTTGETTKLTYTNGQEESPVWSPDGKMIGYFYRENANSNFYLYIMDANGVEATQVSDKPANGQTRLSWSSDGNQLAFTSSEQCGDIYTVNKDGSDLRQITDFNGCAYDPTWSPDGKHIAFIANIQDEADKKSPLYNLMLIGASGENMIEIPIIEYSLTPRELVWSPVPILQIGMKYSITNQGNNINLRSEPSLKSTVVTKLFSGDDVIILEGPIDSDGYFWWKVQISNTNIVGWVAEVQGWFELHM